MKKFRIGSYITGAALIFWFIETAWFGFNSAPINEAEEICDKIVHYGFMLGVFLPALSVLDLLVYHIEKMEAEQDDDLEGKDADTIVKIINDKYRKYLVTANDVNFQGKGVVQRAFKARDGDVMLVLSKVGVASTDLRYTECNVRFKNVVITS